MDNTSKIREEAYRLSEKTLEAQFASALSADQRAMSAAGVTVAAATILAGLSPDATSPLAMLAGAIYLIVGAMFAWRSAMPIKFYTPGSSYGAFEEDIKDDVNYDRVIEQQGGWNDKHISYNDAVMRQNSKNFKRLYWMTVIGLMVAIMPQIWLLFSF